MKTTIDTRTQRSQYLTCTFKSDQNLRVGRTAKQKLKDGKDFDGDEKLGVYHEKYLSKKIMAFHWGEADTRMPEKSDLFEMICFRIKNNVCPDMIVRINDRKVECHSIVLLCYMDLPDEIRSRREVILNEKRISYETFEDIYQWMLTDPEKSHLKLSRENVLQLLEAAKYLGVQELEHQCWAFINSAEIFSEATAFFLYLNAKKNLDQESREPIMQLMLPRIQKFFLILVSSRNWIELDVHDVCALLCSNYTRVRCELEIFMSAVRWLQAEWNSRKQHVVQVMQCVRFGLMSPFHLVEIRQSAEFHEITSVPGVQKLITEGMDVATVKSTHALIPNNRKLSQIFGLTEPSPRHYLKHQPDLYENHSLIYRDFLSQLNKIKEGEISLNEDVETSEDEETVRHKSTERAIHSNKRDKSSNKIKETITEGIYSKEQKPDIPMELKKDTSHVVAKPSKAQPKSYMELNSKNLKKFNEYIEEADTKVRKYHTPESESIQSSEEDKDRHQVTERAESSVFMEESEAVLVFGGVDARAPYSKIKKNGREIYRYNPFLNTWQLIGEMPVARHHHSTVYHNGMVYLAGGVDPSSDEKTTDIVSNSVWSFNPNNKQWTQEPNMTYPRKIFSFVSCLDKIYAIGGQDSKTLLSSVECYDPVAHTWEDVAPLKIARMGMAVAEINDKIWIAGGYTGDKMNPVTDKVECYDPRTNTWTTLATKLRYPRYLATLVSVNNEKLYIIGGASQTDATNTQKMYSVSDLDVLVSNEKEWKFITELVVPRHAHSASVLSSQILIIGGVTTVYKRTLKSVECWCFDRQAWIKGVSGLPATILGHSSVALPLKSN